MFTTSILEEIRSGTSKFSGLDRKIGCVRHFINGRLVQYMGGLVLIIYMVTFCVIL